jgi:hypothetical protein
VSVGEQAVAGIVLGSRGSRPRNSAASEVATVAPTVRAAEGKIPEGGSFVRPLIIHGT